jgi:hypothetical protein
MQILRSLHHLNLQFYSIHHQLLYIRLLSQLMLQRQPLEKIMLNMYQLRNLLCMHPLCMDSPATVPHATNTTNLAHILTSLHLHLLNQFHLQLKPILPAPYLSLA